MIPTFFTTIALGTITNMVATIMALTTWIAGSQIIQGNLFYDTTNNTNPIVYRNTSPALKLTASGTALMSNSEAVFQAWDVPCNNTGGLAKYPFCVSHSPWTTTGSLTLVALECGSTYASLSMSGGLTVSPTLAVGTSLIGFRTVSVGTGGSVVARESTTGALLKWNPTNVFKVQTVTTVNNGSAPDCVLHLEGHDLHGI